MKNRFIIEFFCFFLILCRGGLGVLGVDLSQWNYRADVTLSISSESYGKLMLTPEIYGHCRGDLADLRLIDSQGQQIPYLIFSPHDQTNVENYTPAILSHASEAMGGDSIVVDFEKKTYKNTVFIETEGAIFRRAVKIEASEDAKTYYPLLQEAYIFSTSDTNGIRQHNTVSFPGNDYRYLRISVYPTPENPEPVKILNVRFQKLQSKPAPRHVVVIKRFTCQEDLQKKSTIVEFDLENSHLPLTSLLLDIPAGNFYRYFTLEMRDQKNRKVITRGEDNLEREKIIEEPWQFVQSGVIYHYPSGKKTGGENLAISWNGKERFSSNQAMRYGRLTIRNYDDAPLEIAGLRGQMLPDYILFAKPQADSCTLFLGNEKAELPRYDLAKMIVKPEQVTAAEARLSDITENPIYAKPLAPGIPWTENQKWLIGGILGITVILLGLFAFKSLKSLLSNAEKKE